MITDELRERARQIARDYSYQFIGADEQIGLEAAIAQALADANAPRVSIDVKEAAQRAAEKIVAWIEDSSESEIGDNLTNEESKAFFIKKIIPFIEPFLTEAKVTGVREGLEMAARYCSEEFTCAPAVSKDRSGEYVSGYEDACDHLSIEIRELKSTDALAAIDRQDPG